MEGRAEAPGHGEAADGRLGRGPRAVVLVDEPVPRSLRDPSDAVGVALALVGVVLTLLLASGAPGTATGLAEDVHGLEGLARQVVVVPAAVLERAVALVVPLAVLVELVVRGARRQALSAAVAAALGAVSGGVLVAVVQDAGPQALVDGLSASRGAPHQVSVPVTLAAVVALLVVAGPRRRRRTVGWSWAAVWVTAGASAVTSQASLLGLGVALLLGLAAGLATRFVAGVPPERAYGDELVDAVRRAGVDPVRIARRPGAGRRRYGVATADGRDLELTVLDGDLQVVTALTRLWEAVRLRSVGAPPLSARETAGHLVAVTALVREGGAAAPAVHGVAAVRESTVIVQDGPGRSTALADVAPQALTDAVLDACWDEVRRVHRCGVAHRRLSRRSVTLDVDGPRPRVAFTRWESGQVAADDLLRRVDLAQVLVLLAERVGTARSVASARRALAPDELRGLAALLQPVVLPRETRDAVRGSGDLLRRLRTAVAGDGAGDGAGGAGDEAAVEPAPVGPVRLGGRQVLVVTVAAVAGVVVVTSLHLDDVADAVATADWRWSVAAFVAGLTTFAGVATTYVALAPVRVPVGLAVQVQVAASFVALTAPAGLGPASLNARMLTRRGVAPARAVATVALVQASQVVVTVVLVAVLSAFAGASVGTSAAPVPGAGSVALLVATGVAAVVAVVLLVRPLRAWAGRLVLPVVRQTWPALVDAASRPGRLAVALLGDVVTSAGWVLALLCAVAAFGSSLTVLQAALVYFAGNAVGSLVPTPGGVGSIEVALIAGLTAVGTGPAVAVSAAVLFRAATFWAQLPLGWVALRRLMRRGAL